MSPVPQNAQTPVEFLLSRVGEGVQVAEKAGRAGGYFRDLSAALRFAREEAAHRGAQALVRFDETLAAARAAL
ncbi:MAG: hypothetical protein KGL46_09420 [Hyphomicrobiales bacterium]|nr:hypothetical protein [Hyphomicrobiales bacterium]